MFLDQVPVVVMGGRNMSNFQNPTDQIGPVATNCIKKQSNKLSKCNKTTFKRLPIKSVFVV